MFLSSHTCWSYRRKGTTSSHIASYEEWRFWQLPLVWSHFLQLKLLEIYYETDNTSNKHSIWNHNIRLKWFLNVPTLLYNILLYIPSYHIICRIFEIKPEYVQMEQAKQNRWYLSLFDRWEPDSLEQPIGKLQILNVFNMLFSSRVSPH